MLKRIIEENTELILSKVTSNKIRFIVVEELLDEFKDNVSTGYIEILNDDFLVKNY